MRTETVSQLPLVPLLYVERASLELRAVRLQSTTTTARLLEAIVRRRSQVP